MLLAGVIFLGPAIVFIGRWELDGALTELPVELIFQVGCVFKLLTSLHQLIMLEQLKVFTFLNGWPYLFVRETDSIVQIAKDIHHLMVLNLVFSPSLPFEGIIEYKVDLVRPLLTLIFTAHQMTVH